jgi:hypothetical protein
MRSIHLTLNPHPIPKSNSPDDKPILINESDPLEELDLKKLS